MRELTRAAIEYDKWLRSRGPVLSKPTRELADRCWLHLRDLQLASTAIQVRSVPSMEYGPWLWRGCWRPTAVRASAP